jgi:signal transduction histidine kinase
MSSGLPKSSADLQQDRRVRFEAVRRAGWRGFQAIPLAANDRTVGVLFLFLRERRVYLREEVNLLLAIGKQLGTAVVGADLFDALEWQNRLTQASNRELERSRGQLRNNLDRMAEANRALERLDRMKSQFLALASHELRTPLTYVLSGGELLQERHGARLDEEAQHLLATIVQGGKRLHAVVGDLLEVARLEAQTLSLAREPVDPSLLFAELAAEFQPCLAERCLTLALQPFPAGAQLFGDRHYLKKTFQRLLENAVKFTPAGGRIEAGGALLPAGAIRQQQPDLQPFSPGFFNALPEGPLLQVTIRDNGVGIPPEEQLQIFDKFYEVGEITSHFTSTSRFGGKGVGLGLALVKGMVEAHGGMVWVESPGTGRPGGGSAFQVLLPVAATAEVGLRGPAPDR